MSYQQPTPQPAPQGVQIVTITQSRQRSNDYSPCDRTFDTYQSQPSKVLGWLQIALGLVRIVLQIVGMAIQKNRGDPNDVFHVGAAFWCSPFFIVAGALAVVSSQRQAGGPIIANIIMSVLAAIMGFVFMSVTAATVAAKNRGTYYRNYRFITRERDEGSYAISVIMLMLSFVEIISTIWAFGLGCAVACCGETDVRTTGTTIIPAVNYANPQATTYYGTPANVVQQGAVVYDSGSYLQPQYYPAIAPPAYVEQQGPAEVHMLHPVDGTTQHPQQKY